MILWGGTNTARLKDGARYNPAEDRWTALTTNGAPVARSGHGAVWTGSDMIIWGGDVDAAGPVNDGAAYSPLSDSWRALSANGAPPARTGHAVVWTGDDMLVWGGLGTSGYLTDTWAYRPGREFPLLAMSLTSSNAVVVWWPKAYGSWQLQETTNLASTGSVWIASSYVTNGLKFVHRESQPAASKFYRLYQP